MKNHHHQGPAKWRVGLATGNNPNCLARQWASRGAAMANEETSHCFCTSPMESGGEYPLNPSMRPEFTLRWLTQSETDRLRPERMAQALVKYLQVQFSERDSQGSAG